MRGAFAVPGLRRFVAGWTVGNLADSALFLTLAIWAKDLSGSSSAAGLVFLALGSPVLIAPLLGHLADRVRRKPLLVAGNLVAAAAVLTLLTVDRPGDLWLLYAVTVAYGALGHLNSAAQSGLIRDMLPDEYLATANAAMSTIDQGARIITPLVGAGLYTLWGGGGLAIGVAAALVVTAAVLSTVQVAESAIEAPESSSFWAEAAGGFRHIRGVPLLARILLVTAVAFGVVGVFESALFEVVDKGLGREPAFFGVLMSAQGAGSILGGVTAAFVLRRLGASRAVGLGLGMIGFAAAAMCAAHVLPLVLAGSATAGIGIPWLVVALMTTQQRLTPARLQGRTAAAVNMALTIPQLASIAAGAALITVVDYRLVMALSAAILLVCAVSAAFGPADEVAPAEDRPLSRTDPAAGG